MPAEKFYRNGQMNFKAEWGACQHDNHTGRNCDGLLVEGGHIFEPGNSEHIEDLDRLIAALKRAKRAMLGTDTAVDKTIDQLPDQVKQGRITDEEADRVHNTLSTSRLNAGVVFVPYDPKQPAGEFNVGPEGKFHVGQQVTAIQDALPLFPVTPAESIKAGATVTVFNVKGGVLQFENHEGNYWNFQFVPVEELKELRKVNRKRQAFTEAQSKGLEKLRALTWDDVETKFGGRFDEADVPTNRTMLHTAVATFFELIRDDLADRCDWDLLPMEVGDEIPVEDGDWYLRGAPASTKVKDSHGIKWVLGHTTGLWVREDKRLQTQTSETLALRGPIDVIYVPKK